MADGVLPSIKAWNQLRRELADLRRRHINLAQKLKRQGTQRRHGGRSMAIRIYVGKAASAIASGATGNVSIWIGEPGNETNSGRTIASCYNRTSIAIDSGSWVLVTILGRRKYVEPWECPA